MSTTSPSIQEPSIDGHPNEGSSNNSQLAGEGPLKKSSAEPEHSDDSNVEKTKNAAPGRKRGRPRTKPEKPPPLEKKKMGRPKDESSKSRFTCDMCGKVSKNIRDLRLHQKVHFGIKDFECEYCHMRFVQKGGLKIHVRTHTGEKPYKCPHCPVAFAQKVSLDNHVFKHTRAGVKCPLCPSILANPAYAKQHVRQVHTEERSNVCQLCGKSYKKRRDLNKHIEGHDRRICSVCGKVFDTMYALKSHMHVHAGNRCSFCNRSFKSEEELQAHSKLRGRAYQCELCCYSFNKAEFLSNHHRRNHWKVLGLEQLVWNFPPRPKKPKPPKKEKPDLFAEKASMIDVPTLEVLRPAPTQPVPKEMPVATITLPASTSNKNTESLPVAIDKTIIEESKTEIAEHHDQSDSDTDYPEDVDLPANDDDSDDSSEKDIKHEDEKVAESIDSKPMEVEIKVEVEMEPVSVEVLVKLEEDETGTIQLDNKLTNELEVKKEDSSDSEEDDVPLAALIVPPRRKKKVDVDRAKSSDESSDEDKPIKKRRSKTEVLVSETESTNKVRDTPKKFECKYCHKHFSAKRVLNDHLAKHTGENPKRPFKCVHCSESFRYKCLLKYHMVKHTKEGIKCDLCPMVFAIPATAKQHMDIVHLKEKRHKCQVCDVSFKYRRSLRKHLLRHEDKTCKRCGEVCKGLASLIEHRKTAHPASKDKPVPLVCELCGKVSASASALAVHRGQHKEYLRYKCDECPKAFVFKGLLENHKRVEHQGERHICSICGRQFKYLAYLKRHSYQHKEEKSFKCDKCPAEFRHPSTLSYHNKAKHSAEVFPCTICGKEFSTAYGLRVHKQVHSDEKRYRCEFCPREFIQRLTLVKHLKIHTADRQLKCVVCDQIYYKKVEMTIHHAKEHPNHPLIGRTVKLHTCDVCGMHFVKEGLLRQHSDIHGTEFKFKCDMCEDKKFKQMAGLRYHWHHFHGIEPPKRNIGAKKAEKKVEKPVPAATYGESRSPPFDTDLEFMMQTSACELTVPKAQ
ncbi:zinc finger protein 37 [Aedes albopictus]|uniref:C2H2-type domain-containing protein n=1 Tax=Aedes albopictus TaxID=7160 RepID=A0ABM2A1P2_AEDAL